MSDFVPSADVKNLGIDYDPSLSVTVKSDMMGLWQQLSDNEISEDEFAATAQRILPGFDMDTYNKLVNPTFFGMETGSRDLLGLLTYTNYLAGQEEKRQLHENKMRYINTQVPEGDIVKNDGLFADGFSFKDIKLQDDLSRSKLFITRKKKFLDKYPEGAYTLFTLNAYDNEPIELFKKDKNDDTWLFRLPYGRDVGEFGVFSGNVLNTRNLFAGLAALFSKNPTGLGSFSYLVGGDYAGQQVGATIEQLRGFGEEEFQGEAGVGTLLNYFTNIFSSDIIESLGVGGSQIALNRVMNYFTRKDKSLFGLFGVTKSADDYAAAFERLAKDGYDIAPLVHAQLLQWPLLRASFFQARDFVGFPNQVLTNQSKKLYKSFDEFGHRLAAEGGNPNAISFQELVQLNKNLETQIGQLLKPTPNMTEKALNNNQLLQIFKQWDDTALAVEKQLKDSASKMSKIDGVNFNISALKTLVKAAQRSQKISGRGKRYTKAEIEAARKQGIDLPEFKTVKLSTAFKDNGFNNLLNRISRLDNTVIKFKDGRLWTSSTDQLATIRGDLIEFLSHPNNDIRREARIIYNQLKKTIRRPQGAGEEFTTVWNNYNNILDQNDLIRQTVIMKKALATGDLDASSFVARFLSPDLPGNAALLAKMVPEEQLPAVQNALINQLSRDPTKFAKQFDAWLRTDPDGLVALLGNGRVKELQAMKVIADKYNNPLVQKAFQQSMDEFSPTEFIKFIQKEAETDNLGIDKAVSRFISSFKGGMNSAEISQVRGGIIHNILRNSTAKGKSIYDEGGEAAIDPAKFFVELEKLADDSVLSKFFTKEHLDIIKDFDKYTIAISGLGDVGGPIAAGGERMKILESLTKPSALFGVVKTMLSTAVMARILGNPVTAAKVSSLGPNIYTEKGILILRNILAEGLNDVGVSPAILGDDEDVEKGMILDYAPSQSKQSVINQVIKAEQQSLDGSEMNEQMQVIDEMKFPENLKRKDTKDLFGTGAGSGGVFSPVPTEINVSSINPASRLATGFNQDTFAQGRELFNDPGEITFAAKGGIMNTKKAFQRVI
jgi:hypothetical protein